MSNELEVSAAPTTALVLKPAEYVTAVFAEFRQPLEAAKTESNATKYDVKTTAGMKAAVELRAKFRTIRLDAEKKRKQYKAPLLEAGRSLDEAYKELEAESSKFENLHDTAIKAEETRKEAEKAEKQRVEQMRVAAIKAKIESISSKPAAAMGASSATIRELIESLPTLESITADEFAELAGEAMQSVATTRAKLNEMLAAAERFEADQARLAAERAEFERLQTAARAEQEKREAAAKRVADIRKNIDAISNYHVSFVGKSSSEIQAGIDRISAREILPENFGEYFDEAQQAKATLLTAMSGLHSAALAAERQAAEIERQRAELQADRDRIEAERAEATRIEKEINSIKAYPQTVDSNSMEEINNSLDFLSEFDKLNIDFGSRLDEAKTAWSKARDAALKMRDELQAKEAAELAKAMEEAEAENARRAEQERLRRAGIEAAEALERMRGCAALMHSALELWAEAEATNNPIMLDRARQRRDEALDMAK